MYFCFIFRESAKCMLIAMHLTSTIVFGKLSFLNLIEKIKSWELFYIFFVYVFAFDKHFYMKYIKISFI